MKIGKESFEENCELLGMWFGPDLETIRIPDGELAEWFNQALQAAFKNTSEVQRQQRLTLKKRTAEIEAMQERLLNAYLAGTIDEQALVAKQTQLRDEAATAAATLATSGEVHPEDVQTALGVFQFAHCVVRRPEVERRPNLARFKDGPKTRNPRRGIFEPPARRRNSRRRKEKSV